MFITLCVLTRILINPISNVFQKKLTNASANPLFIIFVTHALLTLACAPALFYLLPLDVTASFWLYILICVLLAVVGNTLLVSALQITDLSVLGPINAYRAVVGLVLGIFLLQEIPSVTGVIGVLLIIAGSYFVVDNDASQPRRNAFVQFFKERGVRLRFAALVLSAIEALFLKKAILLSSPFAAFICWSILGLPVSFLAVAYLLRGRIQSEVEVAKRNKAGYLSLAVTTGLVAISTLFTLGTLQVGYSLALFQTSTIISVFLGYKYFQEQNILRRLYGSIIMISGAVLIIVYGVRR